MNLLIQNETQVAMVINNCIIYIGEKFGCDMSDINHPVTLMQKATDAIDDFAKATVSKPLDVSYVHKLIHASVSYKRMPSCYQCNHPCWL